MAGFVAAAVLLAALIYTLVGFQLERKHYERLLESERARVEALLNRLQSRNLPEYQVYAEPEPEPVSRTYWHDDFGLVADEVT